ncbi:hypothetical protein HOC13_00695 [Candidatus Woesearchaeota archaeon]|nr:hypothetical protein [Candidatus Woesearchaeota archaeon]
MKAAVKKEILNDLRRTVEILEVKDKNDIEELRVLSDHAIEEVALYKDLDLISITVLIYSIYKVNNCMSDEDQKDLVTELKFIINHLEQGNLSRYNKSIKVLFGIVKRCDAKVKVHLQDVMTAAKIKNSSLLLQKGLSIGQAAGLMGLSNWDLQQYAAKTTYLGAHKETIPAKRRLQLALKIFGVGQHR